MQQVKIDYTARILFLCLLVLLYGMGWYLQQNLLLNADVSWLMEASSRFLAGGSYQKDYFELNPPMILYVYIPPVLLAKHFQWSNEFSLRLYIFASSTVSLAICAYLTRFIFNIYDQILRALFILMLAALFWIFPIYEFGQREILFFSFSFPYYLLVAARLYDYKPSTVLSTAIGIMAGIGFAIKPYFLVTFLFTELYYIHKRESFVALYRPEVVAAIAVIATYIALILLLHRDYLTLIVPVVHEFYYQDYRSPFKVLLFNDQAIYFYFSLSLFVLFYKKLIYKQLAIILALAGIGFYCSFMLQSTYWYYHILPMFAAAVALFGLMYFSFATEPYFKLFDYIKLSIWAIIYAAYVITKLNYISLGISFYPSIYFALFIAIYSPLLYTLYRGKHLTRMVFTLALLFAVNYIFYKNVELSIWQKHTFLLANILLFLSFMVALPKQVEHKMRYGYFALLGLLLFAYPFYWSAYLYNASIAFKSQYMGLVSEMRNFPNKSVYFFTDSDQFPFPAVNYTGQRLASRFSSLGGLPILKNFDDPQEYINSYKQYQNRLDIFINAIVEDFEQKKPDVIFVDARRPDLINNLHYFGNNQLDYVQLFSLNANFKNAWLHYHYLKTIDGQPLYKFKIFVRDV